MNRKKYSPKDKLKIYQAYQHNQNKSAVARQFGIDRSYLHEIIGECDEVLLNYFTHKRTGRKKTAEPEDMPQALEQIETLKSEKQQLAKDKEELFIRNAFMELHLSWAERDGFRVKNRHFKKKKNTKS
jgi:transposase-like protein